MSQENTRNVTAPSYFPKESTTLSSSEPFFGDYGYSLPVPWPLIHTAGFWYDGTIPTEKKLIMKEDPEYFATNDIIRTNNSLPTINPSDPIYQFRREDYSIPMTNKRSLNTQKYIDLDSGFATLH